MRFTDYLDGQLKTEATRFTPNLDRAASGARFAPSLGRPETPYNGFFRKTKQATSFRFAPNLQKDAGSPFGSTGYRPGFATGGPGVESWLSGLSVGSGFGSSPLPGAALGSGATPATAIGGGIGAATGDVSVLNQYDSFFREAEQQFGVPASLIKAIAAVERGWEGTSLSGAQGLMQIMPNIWGGQANQLGFGDFATNPRSAILMAANILKQNYQYEQSWEWAARRYLGLGGPDAYGTDHNDYWNRVNGYWQQFRAGTPAGQTGSTGGWEGGFATAFGGKGSAPDWGEFGVASGNGLYGYGRDYGLNGTQHTGIDVPLPLNSPIYAPMGGTVTCAGTGRGKGADGGGCAAFNDYFGSGAGRIEILLDSGAVLIFGHSSQASVNPGQRVSAGAMLGTSGGMNSPHVHLEARVRDSSMPSGWRIVDPRTVLGGGAGIPSGQSGGALPAPGGYSGWQPRITGYGTRWG